MEIWLSLGVLWPRLEVDYYLGSRGPAWNIQSTYVVLSWWEIAENFCLPAACVPPDDLQP